MAASGTRVYLGLLRRFQGRQPVVNRRSVICGADQLKSSQELNVKGRLVQTAAEPQMEDDNAKVAVDNSKKQRTTTAFPGLLSRAQAPGDRPTKLHARQDASPSKEPSSNSKPALLDRLILEGLLFHGFHGVFEEERKMGQKFLVDADAWLDLSPAGESDNLEDSVSYADIYRLIKGVMEGKPHHLLESVAHHIARDILEKYPTIHEVRVKICKPHVAVLGVVDALGVEIRRSRQHFRKPRVDRPVNKLYQGY